MLKLISYFYYLSVLSSFIIFIISFFGALLFATGVISDSSTVLFFISILVVATGVYAARSLYFAVNGDHYGPVGPRGSVSSNVALSVDSLTETYAVADLEADSDWEQAREIMLARLQEEAALPLADDTNSDQ